ncbi:MAG TPA: deoxyribonuclease IV [Abditibacteriaceae bacterium]|nr:deoxyribonuclease IV [Abditibacteriaceae bacterium]
MPLGAHLPTSKGFKAALLQAQELGCDCLQIFSKSPRQWAAPPIDQAKAAAFRAAWHEAQFTPLVVHDSYLINLAAPDAAMRERSIGALVDEVERAEALGCDFLVTHCGAHLQKDCVGADGVLPQQAEAGLQRLAESLRVVLERTPQARVRIALENTAAQGTCLGGPFEHLAMVLHEIQSDRLCVCFDTCHAFAAGHDVATAAGLESTLNEFDRIIGLHRLELIHLNDSKGVLGQCVDRHEHIGQGHIGQAAMGRIVTHARLRHLPFILETPELETMLATNLETVRNLRQGNPGPAPAGSTGDAVASG